MLANYHTHTTRCRQDSGEDRLYVEKAIEGGLRVLGFSDHCPWIYGNGYVSGTRMLPSQLDDYFTSLQKLQREYADDITIYIGFESEYIPELIDAQTQLLRDYPVDYMLLGQHFTGVEPNTYYTGFETTDEERLVRYVDTCMEGICTGKYACTAHPDLMNFVGEPEIFDKHYRRLCHFLKEQNIPLEINMLGNLQHRHYPNDRFWRIAQEVGNTAIIGCDAHDPMLLCNAAEWQACRNFAAHYGLTLIDYLPNLGIRK